MRNKTISNLETQDFIGRWVVKGKLGEYQKQLEVFQNLKYKYYPDTTNEEDTYEGKAFYKWDNKRNEGALTLENYGKFTIAALDEDREGYRVIDKKRDFHYRKVTESVFK